jgi:hypothetical protein
MKKSDAQKYRLMQVEKLLSLFEDANGRPADTIEELDQWIGSVDGKSYLSTFHDKSGKIIPDFAYIEK